MKTLTITIIGTGLGTTIPTLGTHEYADNSVVSGITAFPNAGYEFNRWLLDGVQYTSNPITVVMDVDHLLEAEFSGEPPPPPPTYNLNITTTEGGVTEPGVGLYVYDVGNVVMVTAFPSEGYRFDGWLLDGVARAENPITVTMSQDHSLHAVFASEEAPSPMDSTLVIGIIATIVTVVVASAVGYAYFTGVF